MKKILILFAATICLVSCKKLRNNFDCECSNGKTFHMNNEYEYAKGTCEYRERNFNDTSHVRITCKLK